MFQYCEELQTERTRLQNHISELEEILKASDNEKDQVLKGLREHLESTQQQLTERENLVRTLSEESRVLHKQLIDVAQQCQGLARKLTERSDVTDKVTRETLQTVSVHKRSYSIIGYSLKQAAWKAMVNTKLIYEKTTAYITSRHTAQRETERRQKHQQHTHTKTATRNKAYRLINTFTCIKASRHASENHNIRETRVKHNIREK